MAAVIRMKTPSIILSECQAPFSWGPDGHNCLTTIEALAKEYLPNYKPLYSAWLAMDEPKSWRKAIKDYGSLLECHRQILTGAGLIEVGLPYQPGDLVVSTFMVTVEGAEWDSTGGRELLLFVDDSHRLWYWGVSGLNPAQVSEQPSTMFRFPALVRS